MLYIVTVIKDRKEITLNFIRLLLKQSYKDFQLIVVDDGSSDGSAQAILSLLSSATIIHGNGNMWWGGGLHLAYNHLKKTGSREDYVMITNDDVYFEQDYISSALNILINRTDTLLTGCGISNISDKIVDGAINYNFISCSFSDVHLGFGNCCSTRSLFLKLPDFKKIGDFYPYLLPHYYSDYEWTIRAHFKGYKILCDKSVVYKVNDYTTGIRNSLSFHSLFSKKNVSNPLYRTSFVLLSTPFYLIPLALFTLFLNYLCIIFRLLFQRN